MATRSFRHSQTSPVPLSWRRPRGFALSLRALAREALVGRSMEKPAMGTVLGLLLVLAHSSQPPPAWSSAGHERISVITSRIRGVLGSCGAGEAETGGGGGEPGGNNNIIIPIQRTEHAHRTYKYYGVCCTSCGVGGRGGQGKVVLLLLIIQVGQWLAREVEREQGRTNEFSSITRTYSVQVLVLAAANPSSVNINGNAARDRNNGEDNMAELTNQAPRFLSGPPFTCKSTRTLPIMCSVKKPGPLFLWSAHK